MMGWFFRLMKYIKYEIVLLCIEFDFEVTPPGALPCNSLQKLLIDSSFLNQWHCELTLFVSPKLIWTSLMLITM